MSPVLDVQVSVVIPCRNEELYVTGVLDALRTQDAPADEVIIVDGGSVDGTMEVVRRYGARHPDFPLRVVTAHGSSIPAAVNIGISASRSDVIARMDSHSRPAVDYLRRALQALHETDAAVVGGIWQISPGGPGLVAAAIARAAAHPMGAGDAAYRLRAGPSGRHRVDTVPFGCFRRAHWQQIGGYNDQLLANEDYDFNYRSRRCGSGVLLDSAIQCEYFARPTLAGLAGQYFRYGWWKGRMLRYHPGSIRLRQVIPALFLPMWLALGVTAVLLPVARPAVIALLAAYAVVLVAAGVHAAAGEWRIAVPTAAAFLTIHTAWSAGFASFFLTGASVIARRQPGGRRPRAGLTGGQLAVALSTILLLSVIVPWSMARRVHESRIARAEADVKAIADALRADNGTLGGYQPETILVGPGADPQIPQNGGWRNVLAISATGLRLPLPLRADPWGNHYLIFPPSRDLSRPAARWVLSAGPNGILETPFEQNAESAALSGDDIGVRLH